MSTVGIVTGAGRGMGFACAQRLTGLVDTLILVDLDADGAARAAEELGGQGKATVEPYAADVSDPARLARLAERVGELGTLRAVAHAAGISPTMADWRRIVTVDLVGTARLLEALRPLVTEGTAFVCFASMAPLLGPDDAAPAALAALDDPLAEGFLDRLGEAVGPTIADPGQAYSWAKRGVQRLARREAVRLGPLGARVCSLSPGIIDTPQGRQESANHASMAALVQRTPLGREGRPEEIAAVVAFALSADASFLTGIDLLVDGGVVAALKG